MTPAPELAVGGWVAQYAPQELAVSKTGFAAGGRVRLRWTEVWGAELVIGANPIGPNGNLALVRFLGEPSADLVAHVAVGVGITGSRAGFAALGGGFDVVLLPWLDVRADARFEIETSGNSALLFAVGPVLHTRRAYDADADTIPDRVDTCLREPEDLDGHLDTDGCPDPDNDGDGVLDTVDRCVALPEDLDGNLDKDGCPDPDDDDDGVADGADGCRDTPEDLDQFEDLDGCPDVDNDRDFVRDEKDQCPDVAEDGDAFEDDDGCPDPDNDGDGAADRWDDAPLEPETYNGWRDDDGAPDTIPPVLQRFLGPLEVRLGHAGEVEGASLGLLASVLASFPEARIDVVGPEGLANGARVILILAGAGEEQVRAVSGGPEVSVRMRSP